MTKHNKSTHFYDSVESMVSGGSSVLDSIVEYCSKNNLEVEAVVPLVNRNPRLVSRLREEAEGLNVLEKTAHLPI